MEFIEVTLISNVKMLINSNTINAIRATENGAILLIGTVSLEVKESYDYFTQFFARYEVSI